MCSKVIAKLLAGTLVTEGLTEAGGSTSNVHLMAGGQEASVLVGLLRAELCTPADQNHSVPLSLRA